MGRHSGRLNWLKVRNEKEPPPVAVGRRVGCRHCRQQRRRRAGQPKLRLLQLQLGANVLNLFFFVTFTSKNLLACFRS